MMGWKKFYQHIFTCVWIFSMWLCCDPYIDGRIPLWFQTSINGEPVIETAYTDDGTDAYILDITDWFGPGEWINARVRACDDDGCSDWTEADLQIPGGGEDLNDDNKNSSNKGCFISSIAE